MSAQTALSLPKRFLREFQFSTLGQAVIAELMGEVRLPHWLNFTITHQPSAKEKSFVFTITVTAQAHKRVMQTGVGVRNIGLDQQQILECGFSVPQSVIDQFREQLPELFEKWMKAALLENAHRLYELDPRAGWLAKKDDLLPRCPLFDPPEKFSRLGVPTVSASDPGLEPSCPFCDRSHSWIDPPVWAGANLMWVHRQCWEAPT